MGLFDKLFKQNKSTFTPAKELNIEIFDMFFDWFKEAEKSVPEFEEQFFQPILKDIEADDRQKWSFENQRELTTSNYYVCLAAVYLANHYPVESYLIKLLDNIFDDSGYFFRETLCSHKLSRFKVSEDHSKTIFIGNEIILSYQAAIYKKDENFSNISSIACRIGQRAYYKGDTAFECVFKFVTNLIFNEKIYYILTTHSVVPYRFGRSNEYEKENQFEDLIKTSFDLAVREYNAVNKLQLSSEILWDYHEAFHKITQTDLWNNTDYKKRKYLKIKDFPDTEAFIEKYKHNANVALQNLLYILKLEYVEKDKNKIYRELLSQLAPKCSSDLVWIADIIEFYDNTNNFDLVFNYLIISILLNNISNIPFNDPLVKKFEPLIFKKVYGSSPTKAINLMNKLCDNIENKSTRAFEKLKYSEVIANCYFQMPQHYLEIEAKSVMNKRINNIVDQLNLIVPAGLKSFKHQSWYPYEEVEFLKLNLDGQDYSFSFDLVVELNKYFVANKIGYQFLPIPMVESKNGDSLNYHISVLAFVNQAQFSLLQDYIRSNFPTLINSPAYKNANFSDLEAPSIYELEHSVKGVNEKGDNLLSIENDGSWSWFKSQYIDELSSKEKWYRIVPVLSNYKGGKKPNKKWLKDIEKAIETIGKEQYIKELAVLIPPSLKEDFWFLDNYANTLKGIIITCTKFPTDSSLSIVKDIIWAAYTKIPGVGPRSTANGNFALKALVESGDDKAFGILNVIRNRTKYQRFIKVLDKHIELFASFSDTDSELLADKAIPRLGFEGNTKTMTIANYQHKVFLEGQKIKKCWIDEAGNKYKSIPEEIKEDHPKKLKEITVEVKQASTIFKDLKSRIKTYWLNNREWSGQEWNNHIFNHPLVYPWIEGMIWKNESNNSSFIVLNKTLFSFKNDEVSIGGNDRISLWHPVNSSKEDLLNWQNYVGKHKIKQTERQAFREHYPFYESEKKLSESPRFAHHFLEVKKLMAIANSTGWIFTYVHEDVSWPRTYIKALDLSAHIICDYTRSDDFIPTKNIIITKGDTTKISATNTLEGIPFKDIPKMTLSEICRDIDLFIATTSVANNPELSERSEILGNYRKDFLYGTFSENANSMLRKEILPPLLNQMGVSNFDFEGNFLIINGSLNKYRINLGSGFAQIYGTLKHLTLIPDTSKVKKKYLLPIIEDETLNIIVAKAIFLHNDNEIYDGRILTLIKTE
ncbi:MAG: DUF4132 domain-containing protein [Marinifilaceae bacterium]